MTKNTIGIIILIAILFVGGLYFVNGGFQLSTTGSNSLSEGDVQVGAFYVPTFGTLKCQKWDGVPSYYPSATTYKKFGQHIFKCSDYGINANSCDIEFKLPSKDEVKGKDSFLAYRKCSLSNTDCDINKFETREFARKAYGIDGTNYNGIVDVHLNRDQYLVTYYVEGDFFSAITGADVVNKGRYKVSWQPYYIVRYDGLSSQNAQYIMSTTDCRVNGDVSEINYMIENVLSNGALSDKVSNEEWADTANSLSVAGNAVPYVSGLVNTINLEETVVDGQEAYCRDKKLYKVEKVQTPSGIFRLALLDSSTQSLENSNFIKNVECCNDGDVLTTTEKCVDFKIVPRSSSNTEKCLFDSQCQVGYVGIGGGKAIYETCEQGICQTNFLEGIKCMSNLECNGGTCITFDDPKKNYCKDTVEVNACGNGFCELSRGENQQSCPADCSPVAPKNSNGLLFFLIGAIVIMIFAIIFFVAKGKSNGGNDILA